jgi:hypothetical protein
MHEETRNTHPTWSKQRNWNSTGCWFNGTHFQSSLSPDQRQPPSWTLLNRAGVCFNDLLCWGCRARATRRFLMKLHLTHRIFANIIIVNISVACFTVRGILIQRWSSSLTGGPASVHLSGGPWGIEGSLRGSQVVEVSQNVAVLAVDTCQSLIGQAYKSL